MTIKITTTYGEPKARASSATYTHVFDTREDAEHFAEVFNRSPIKGDNARFGWALGYLAKEGEQRDPSIVTFKAKRKISAGEFVTAEDVEVPTSLLDQVRAAAPLKDGWEWEALPAYGLVRLSGGDDTFGQVYPEPLNKEECTEDYVGALGSLGEGRPLFIDSVEDAALAVAADAGALAEVDWIERLGLEWRHTEGFHYLCKDHDYPSAHATVEYGEWRFYEDGADTSSKRGTGGKTEAEAYLQKFYTERAACADK